MINRLAGKLDNGEQCGFAHSMAELQWLLLILVALYFFVPTGALENRDTVIAGMVAYSAFILVFRYFGIRLRESRMKLAIESWAMIAFITVVLWNTGYTESPLLNLYLLVIVACAITLGKAMTLLEVFLIACCYLHMSFSVYSVDMFTLETFTLLMARFSPFMLVAYVTSLLASDILSARQKINLLAQTDELTGVLNMRAFRLLLEKEMTSAVRHRESFSIVMVDIDELNRVNDQYGHANGDRMLQTASRTLKNCLRATDIVARSGNDEFIILMTHCSMNHARLVAERILKATATMSFDIDADSVTTTASIGIAGFPECTADATKVLDMANRALGRSKRDGRNRISCHEEATELPESVTDINSRRVLQSA